MLQNLFNQIVTFYNEGPWLVKICIVVFLVLLATFIEYKFLKRVHAKLKNTGTHWDHAFIEALRKPLVVFFWLVGLTVILKIIQTQTGHIFIEDINPIRTVSIILLITWFLIRFIIISKSNIIEKKQLKGVKFDRTTLDAISKLLKLTTLIISAIVIAQTLGFTVSGLLAFGGISGIAIGFAAKDLLSNFFGGLMIYLDRPFNVGDWIRSPDREIEGTVEEIGWRLTIIRTFDKRPLYVPNAIFANIAVENPSRMTNRRIKETIGIRYDDANKIDDIITDVKSMLEEHEEIDTSQTLIVNFNSFAPSSLDFFIYTFTKTTNWIRFHEIKQDVLLKVLAIITNHGAETAFPTSTLHIKPDQLINDQQIPN
ncbi:MAG: mechanosensitive ion channel family protein [Gammaproteobacteria bacterium]